MKKFYHNNKCLFFASVFSIIYIFIILIFNLFSNNWCNVFFQLAIGIIVNLIFYLTQVYFPKVKQTETVYQCMDIRISNIINHMTGILTQIENLYGGIKKDSIKSKNSQYLDLLRKINLEDEIPITNIRRIGLQNHRFTLKEWIIGSVQSIEKEINDLFTYYNLYITPELMSCLESILTSMIHTHMAKRDSQMNVKIDYSSINEDIYLKQYYDLVEELNKIKNNL